MPSAPTILFTAFEPSGDDHASGVIASLKAKAPHVKIMAMGGPKMKAAGAELIEETTQHAVMLAGAVGQAVTHKKRVGRLRNWLKQNDITALIPVDSPAANWSICQAVRDIRPNAKILHLVAPQLWAWAPGRIVKLRRLTDHVMCLLPFEPAWFGQRGVDATFVGHPLFDKPHRMGEGATLGLPSGASPKLALLPGSRKGEIKRNWPTMLMAVAQLRSQFPDMVAVGALRDDDALKLLPGSTTGQDGKAVTNLPPGVLVRTGKTEAVLDWADAVLVVSGTATLLVASYRKPMAAMFNVSRLQWQALGRWLVKTRTFTLPNLIAESMGLGRVIPELVPHFGDVQQVVDAMTPLLGDEKVRAEQSDMLAQVISPFHGHACGQEAANLILEKTGLG